MIHKHAGQLLSDGLCQHRSQHRGIHAAGQGAQHLAVANALPQSLDIVLHEGVHLPVTGAATDVIHEVAEHLLTLSGVEHLRVELNSVEASSLISHTGNGASRSRAHQFESRRHFSDFVAVAHPNLQIALAVFIRKVGYILQEFCVAVFTNFCVAELTLSTVFNLAAELLSHCLHAVANA